MKEDIGIFIEFCKKIVKNRYMLGSMAVRDIKSRYVGSVFGFVWAVLYPIFQMAIFGVIFGVFFKAKPDPIYHTDNFFIYLVSGLIPFQFLSQSVSQCTGSIRANRNLVKKAVGFPSEMLPMVTVISNIFNHFIGIALLITILALFGIFPSVYIMSIFIYLFFISVFGVGIGWILSSLNVFLRDVQQVVGIVMTAWFYFSPILYSPTLVPESVMPIYKLNPMYYFVVGYRHALLGRMLLPWQDILYLACIAFVTFGVGGLVFRRLKPGFAEVL